MKYLYALIATLALAVVGLDHYVVRSTLNEFDMANKMNAEQFMDMVRATQAIQFSEKCQEVALIQARKLAKLDTVFEKYSEGIKQLKDENARLLNVLEESATTIKELTDENAALAAKLDLNVEVNSKLARDYNNAQKTIELLKTQLVTNTVEIRVSAKKIEDLEKKLSEALNTIKCDRAEKLIPGVVK